MIYIAPIVVIALCVLAVLAFIGFEMLRAKSVRNKRILANNRDPKAVVKRLRKMRRASKKAKKEEKKNRLHPYRIVDATKNLGRT